MSGREWGFTLALALAAGWAAADERVRNRDDGPAREAGSAESRHPSPERSASVSEPSPSSAPASAPDPSTGPEQRHPRAGTGTGHRRGRFGSFSGYYGYRPRYYGYHGYYGYDDFYFGYSPYYSGYYGYLPYSYRYSRYYRDTGSVRVLVDPEKTRVYVDGYYAGIADDFDGLFQRLYLSPGRHEITLKLEGYRTQRFKVYVPYGQTIKLHHEMTRGSGEEPAEEVIGRPAGYVRYEDEDRPSRASRERGPEGDLAGAGTLRLEVRPSDASVYVDGVFRGPAGENERLSLPPGRHRIEVVRPGFRTVERDVEIESGRTKDLQVELER